MSDLHSIAEAARLASPEALSSFRAYLPRPAAAELRPIPESNTTTPPVRQRNP